MKRNPLHLCLGLLLGVLTPAAAVHAQPSPNRVLFQGLPDLPAFDVRALGVDFYALPCQKWLCGIEGLGALYVRRERQADLAPTFTGFFMVHDGGVYDLTGNFVPAPGARRYETSTPFWPGLVAMRAVLDHFAW